MALSGTFYTNVRSGWRLQAEWKATQNISANQSTVTAYLYWISLGSSYVINSSATKSGNIIIEGTTYSFSGGGLATLKGNQKRLLTYKSKTITHNSDGTFPDLDIQCNFNPEVTLSGSYQGNISISKSYALNTIPRASTISSRANWTAGKNLSVTISRKSSSFTHTVRVLVGGTLIADKEGVTTSTTFAFSNSQNETIFDKINASTGAATRIEVLTYKGSSKIGSTAAKTGTVSAIAASVLSSSANFNIGDPVNISISRQHSYITHTVKIYVNNTLIKTLTGVGSSTTWTPSAAETTNMYNQTKNSNSVGTRIEVYSYWGSEQIRNASSKSGTARVTNSNPVFGTGFTYQDTNTTSKNLTGNTGNDGLIIQNISNVQVTLPTTAFASPKNGASITQYIATLNGKEVVKTPSSSNIIFDMGKVTSDSDVTLSVKAVDSRGNSTTQHKTVKIAAYSNPKINSTVTRKNNYEVTTTIKTNGTISLVSGKNAIQSLQYRYRENVSSASFGSWFDITRTTSGNNFTGNDTSLSLDNTKSYVFEIKAADKLGSTTITKTVSSGKPILSIDAEKASVGVGMFPTETQQLQVEGKITTMNNLGTIELSGRDFKVDNLRAMVGLPGEKKVSINYKKDFADGVVTYGDLEIKDGSIHFPSNMWGDSESGPAMHFNNSDMFGVNNIWFNDATGSEEGLFFPKSGTTIGSISLSDYDKFKVLNGVGYLNGSPAFVDNDRTVLWTGELYMSAGHEITPKKNILDCPNGWALCWSRYNGSAQNDNFQMSFIPRGFVLERGDTGGIRVTLTDINHAVTTKYMYVRNNGRTLLGHDMNNDDAQKYAVLRYVFAF